MTRGMKDVFEALQASMTLDGEHAVNVAFVPPDDDVPSGFLTINGFVDGEPAFSLTVLDAALNAIASPGKGAIVSVPY